MKSGRRSEWESHAAFDNTQKFPILPPVPNRPRMLARSRLELGDCLARRGPLGRG